MARLCREYIRNLNRECFKCKVSTSFGVPTQEVPSRLKNQAVDFCDNWQYAFLHSQLNKINGETEILFSKLPFKKLVICLKVLSLHKSIHAPTRLAARLSFLMTSSLTTPLDPVTKYQSSPPSPRSLQRLPAARCSADAATVLFTLSTCCISPKSGPLTHDPFKGLGSKK